MSTKNSTRIIAVALPLLVTSRPALAQMYCSEPRKPTCIEYLAEDSEIWEFDGCRLEVESFVRETNDYVACLENNKVEAVDQAKKAIERFNCRAERNAYCF